MNKNILFNYPTLKNYLSILQLNKHPNIEKLLCLNIIDSRLYMITPYY